MKGLVWKFLLINVIAKNNLAKLGFQNKRNQNNVSSKKNNAHRLEKIYISKGTSDFMLSNKTPMASRLM